MRVRHLNAATMCPAGGRLLLGSGRSLLTGTTLVCHCLLIETEEGLVLVDTGLGLDDIHAGSHRRVRLAMRMLGARLDAEETLARQVERLGFGRDDVRHIVLTHLDPDHAGGMGDFPRAKVHVYAREHAGAVVERPRWQDRLRYHEVQWAHGPRWERYEPQGEPWFGFECVRGLRGLPPEILLVPLLGHSYGHCAVAVDTGAGWLLHAGDAYFFHGEMDPVHPWCPPGMKLIEKLDEVDRAERLHNQERLRELVQAQAGKVQVFCAHDEEEWGRLAGKSSTATPGSRCP